MSSVKLPRYLSRLAIIDSILTVIQGFARNDSCFRLSLTSGTCFLTHIETLS